MEIYLLAESQEQPGAELIEYISGHFSGEELSCRFFPGIGSPQEVEEVIKEAGNRGAVIAHSFLDGELRAEARKQAWKLRVQIVDLLGPLLNKITSPIEDWDREGKMAALPSLEENYYKKIEAIEFAVRCDDGQDLSALARADLVILGISRTSKTPLSIYLAHWGYRVANVPLVPEVFPPREIFSLTPSRIIGLTIDPEVLRSIRRERLRVIKMPAADYSTLDRIYKEMEFGQEIMKRIGCLTVEVTGRSLEELAAIILEKGAFADGKGINT